MVKKKGLWRCRHKENCQSYVEGIVKELNEGKSQEGFMYLVEFVRANGTVRDKICPNCRQFMYEIWDKIAKEYTGYVWRCKCMPKNFELCVG